MAGASRCPRLTELAGYFAGWLTTYFRQTIDGSNESHRARGCARWDSMVTSFGGLWRVRAETEGLLDAVRTQNPETDAHQGRICGRLCYKGQAGRGS